MIIYKVGEPITVRLLLSVGGHHNNSKQ